MAWPEQWAEGHVLWLHWTGLSGILFFGLPTLMNWCSWMPLEASGLDRHYKPSWPQLLKKQKKKNWGFAITLVKMERSFKNFTHWQARYSKTFVDLRMALLPKPMGRNYFIHYLKPDCDSKLPRPPIPLQTENPSVKKNKKNKTNLTCKVFTSQRNTNSRGSSLTRRSVLFYLARPSTRGAKTYSIMSWKRAAGEIRSRYKK